MLLLSDGQEYKKLRKDPSPSLERRMNELLLSLKRSGAIRSTLYYHLRSSAGKVPLLYGLPKIHKPAVPLRPIVSFVNSPTYQLSKHLVNIRKLYKHEYNITTVLIVNIEHYHTVYNDSCVHVNHVSEVYKPAQCTQWQISCRAFMVDVDVATILPFCNHGYTHAHWSRAEDLVLI